MGCQQHGSDYKVIFVGDASMSPYEVTYEGGSVEHWNEELALLAKTSNGHL